MNDIEHFRETLFSWHFPRLWNLRAISVKHLFQGQSRQFASETPKYAKPLVFSVYISQIFFIFPIVGNNMVLIFNQTVFKNNSWKISIIIYYEADNLQTEKKNHTCRFFMNFGNFRSISHEILQLNFMIIHPHLGWRKWKNWCLDLMHRTLAIATCSITSITWGRETLQAEQIAIYCTYT